MHPNASFQSNPGALATPAYQIQELVCMDQSQAVDNSAVDKMTTYDYDETFNSFDSALPDFASQQTVYRTVGSGLTQSFLEASCIYK